MLVDPIYMYRRRESEPPRRTWITTVERWNKVMANTVKHGPIFCGPFASEKYEHTYDTYEYLLLPVSPFSRAVGL